MIHVIKEIMFDCAYENVVQTEVMFEEKEYNLNIFKHREVESQIFIVLQILESQLVAQDNYKDLVIEIANYFRENDIYVPDMDKNTSLIYCVKRDIKSNKLDELKVKIEDDPFYFKKYVFVYSEAQSVELKKLFKHIFMILKILTSLKRMEIMKKYINWFRNYLLKFLLFR